MNTPSTKTPEERFYKILVYASEKMGLHHAPMLRVNNKHFELIFAPYDTSHRFNEFDGLIYFQGVFESFDWRQGTMEVYLNHKCDEDMLDRRKKELQLLIRAGGFSCCILTEEFIDTHKSRDFMGTDLAKYQLNGWTWRKNFGRRQTHVECKVDELRPFFEVHGAASTSFSPRGTPTGIKEIATVSGHTIGMVFDRSQYFVPSLVPANTKEVLQEYFEKLADGLVRLQNKSVRELPAWAASFVFEEESKQKQDRIDHLTAIEKIDSRLSLLDSFKFVLVGSGDDLTDTVAKLFDKGFGIPVDSKDEYREDLKLVKGKAKTPFCLCEVKGVNGGVKREHVNQADSHRERSGFAPDFPVLLIANTHIKGAKTITEKDQQIVTDQIQHAHRLGILILRTIDLLELLKMYLQAKISQQEIVEKLTTVTGWLRVTEAGLEEIQTGPDPTPKTSTT